MRRYIIIFLILVSEYSCRTQGLVSSMRACNISSKDVDLAIGSSGGFYMHKKAQQFTVDTARVFNCMMGIMLDSSYFKSFVEHLVDGPVNNESFSMVLYYGSNLSDADTLRTSFVRGVSVYSLKGKSFVHTFYSKKDGDFIELPELSTKTYAIGSTSISRIAEDILFQHQNGFTTIILDRDSAGEAISRVRGPDLLNKKVTKFINAKRLR